MIKKMVSVLLAAGMAASILVSGALAGQDNKAKEMYQENHGQPGMHQERQSQPDTAPVKEGADRKSVSEDVYSGSQGRHMGIPNALQQVKNPLARTVLQAIQDSRSVSEAVYQFRCDMDDNIDPGEVEVVIDEIDGKIAEDSSIDSKTRANAYKQMSRIQLRVGKPGEALKYMELSARNNPQDEETFREMDSLFAGKNDFSVKVYINGTAPAPDVPPRIADGRTLVPVRFIAEGLGANISYDEATGTVSIEGNEMSIKMKIDSNSVFVNGRQVNLDVPASIEAGRTMVPLRFIGEGFRCKVNYYGGSNLVTVNSQV